MRRRTALITSAAVAVAAVGTGLGIWLSQPSYDDVLKDCSKALVAQAKAGGKGKPKACDGVKKDDYDTLSVAAAIDGLGWTDSDGNFDESKMLDSLDK